VTIYETDTSLPETIDTSTWGYGSQTGELPIRDAVETSSTDLSSAVNAVTSEVFKMISLDGQISNSTYLRGLQLLYLYDLHWLAISYWPDAERLISSLSVTITGVSGIRDLEVQSDRFSELSSRYRSMLNSTTIDKKTLQLVREETSVHGKMSAVLESVLLFFVILGAANSGGSSI
jgi:hypothetical protein